MHPDALAARLACILLGYLFGSFLTAEVVARVVSGKSARQLGTGNPGMAKGGSGDVLAGMLGALLCQMPARDAVQTAVWLHGRAGDLCAGRMGEYAMNPTDVIAALPEVTKPIIR